MNPVNQKYAEVLIMCKKRINTAYGSKSVEGIADLLENYYQARVKWDNAMAKVKKENNNGRGGSNETTN